MVVNNKKINQFATTGSTGTQMGSVSNPLVNQDSVQRASVFKSTGDSEQMKSKLFTSSNDGNTRKASKRGVSGRTSSRRAIPKARRMKLSVTKVDPWSVAKVSFLLSVANGIIQLVMVTVLWFILSAIGLFDKVNTVISQAGLSNGSMDVASFLGLGQVLSWVTIFAIFQVILIVILSVIGAFLYNVVSSLVGGIHVTLGDD